MGTNWSMNSFRMLEHTADIGIAAVGENLAALFVQMGYGLCRVMTTEQLSGKKSIQC